MNNNDFAELLKNIPVLKCKAIVDIINGAEVVDEQIQFRCAKSTFLKRVFLLITGESFKRQNIIDQTLSCSIKGLTIFMQESNKEQLYTFRSINDIQHKLLETRNGLAKLIDQHIVLKNEVSKLKTEVVIMYDFLNAKIDTLLQNEILKKLRHDADAQINSVFTKWEAGYLNKLHPFFQLTFVLQELFWGPFGRYSRIDNDLNDLVYNKCTIQIKKICGLSTMEEHVSLNNELIEFPRQIPIYKEAFTYLLEQNSLQVNKLPILYVFSKTTMLEDENNVHNWLENNRPLELPFLTTYERLLEKIMEETMIHSKFISEGFSYDKS